MNAAGVRCGVAQKRPISIHGRRRLVDSCTGPGAFVGVRNDFTHYRFAGYFKSGRLVFESAYAAGAIAGFEACAVGPEIADRLICRRLERRNSPSLMPGRNAEQPSTGIRAQLTD